MPATESDKVKQNLSRQCQTEPMYTDNRVKYKQMGSNYVVSNLPCVSVSSDHF